MISGEKQENKDFEITLRIILMNTVSIVAALILMILGISVLKDRNFVIGFLDLSLASILIMNQIYVRTTQKYSSTKYVLVFSSAALFIYLFATGGINSTGHLWVYTYPLLSSFLLGSRKGAVAASAMLASSILLSLINPFSWDLNKYSFDFLIRFTVSFCFVSFSSYFFEHFREETKKKLVLKNAELDHQVIRLKEAEEALKKNQEGLERQKEDRILDLKKINESLKIEIKDRKKTEDLLRASEEKYRLLFENSLDIIYSLDRELKVINVSPSVERVLGYKPAELLGKSVYELKIVSEKSLEVALPHIMRVFGGESIASSEYKFIAKDGTPKIGQVSGAPLFRSGEVVGLISIARDITEAKKAEGLLQRNEEAAKRLAQENSVMAEIGKVINLSLNIEEVYKLFSEKVSRILPYDRIAINLVNKDGRTLTNRYVEGVSAPGRNIGEIFPMEGTLTAEVIQNRKSFLVNSQDENEISEKYPGLVPEMKAGSRSFLSVPLVSRNQPIGGLHLRSNRYRAYSEKDLKLAENIAAQIAGAVANAQLFAELKRTEEDLRHAQFVLEQKVYERTAELMKANNELKIEISERLRAEEELKRAKEGAESANRAKSDFLANMSHELRTPLNHILGFTELVADKQCGELNEVQEEYLNDVLQSSRHLLSLINDILDLSKVEAGKLELAAAEVSLRDLLMNSLLMVKEKALKHGIQLSLEIDGVPDWVPADERKLKQILYNLLANAVKFTPAGGTVVLAARSLSYRQGGWVAGNGQGVEIPFQPTGESRWVEVSVRDTGIGLKKEDLERIFAPFEQADNTVGRRYQGTGLGLSLTQRLVELHGGKSWAESEGEGKGSKFTFVIPFDPSWRKEAENGKR